MRRLLAAAVPLLLLAVPATGHAYTLGVSDQQAVDLHEPAVRAAEVQGRALHHALRRDGLAVRLAAAQAWIGAAQAANQRVLVAFERSHRAGRERRLPSVAEYKREITKFHQAFPT